jgi:hypothetical protein
MAERRVSIPAEIVRDLYPSQMGKKRSEIIIVSSEDDNDDDADHDADYTVDRPRLPPPLIMDVPWRKAKTHPPPDPRIKRRSPRLAVAKAGKKKGGGGGGPVKKRREEAPPPEEAEEPIEVSDKLIICSGCIARALEGPLRDEVKKGHYIYPGFAGAKGIPSYDALPLGVTTVTVCNDCPSMCGRCHAFTADDEIVECDNPPCLQMVCFACQGTNKVQNGPFWCSDDCRNLNERPPPVTGLVLPFCTNSLLHYNNHGNPPEQQWAVCKTCVMCVCIACAMVCHESHDVVPAIPHNRGSCYGRDRCRCGDLKCCTPPPLLREKVEYGDKLAALVREQLDVPQKRSLLVAALAQSATEERLLTDEREKVKANRAWMPGRKKKVEDAISAASFRIRKSRCAIDDAIGTAEEPRLRDVNRDLELKEKELLVERQSLQSEDGSYALALADIERRIRQCLSDRATIIDDMRRLDTREMTLPKEIADMVTVAVPQAKRLVIKVPNAIVAKGK